MKTVKYYIEFSGLDVDMSTRIPISKAEFYHQLSFLKKQVEETQDKETPLEQRQIEDDSTMVIKTVYYFTCGTSEVCLTKFECKPGYCFTKA